MHRTSGGGSLINVLLLVKHLDRSRYRPTVLFYESNPYIDDFKEAGAEVRLLEDGAPDRPSSQAARGNGRRASGKREHFRSARQLNGFFRRDWPLARRIAQVIEDSRADLVQSSICPSADRASIFAAGLARVRQVSYSQYFTADTAFLDRPLSALVDRYLCISEAVRQQVLRASGVFEAKTRLVYAPFEFPAPGATSAATDLRASLGVNGDHRVIANVGRLIPWKGQDVFLRAFASIAEAQPDARALIVGSAGDKSAGHTFEEELRRFVSERALTERVVFTGHRDDVAEIMSASDVVVHSSSQAEPLGRVIMEAIALERPVIATGAGGVPEMVRDGATGFLVPPGDADAMARALASVLEAPERAAGMAARARREAEGRFAASTFVRAMESEYDRILGF